jgi:hypothetical protein
VNCLHEFKPREARILLPEETGRGGEEIGAPGEGGGGEGRGRWRGGEGSVRGAEKENIGVRQKERLEVLYRIQREKRSGYHRVPTPSLHLHLSAVWLVEII